MVSWLVSCTFRFSPIITFISFRNNKSNNNKSNNNKSNNNNNII